MFLGLNYLVIFVEGYKLSFCLEDIECDVGFEKRWNCIRGGD